MSARDVYLETFGCQMNELDSELVAGALRSLGYRFVSDAEDAGVVLYNTCSVREHAEQKVWSRLGELKARKQNEPALVVGVLGCMAERDGEDLIRRMPVVDILCGPGELDKLPALLDNAVRTRMSLVDQHESALARAGHQGRSAQARDPIRDELHPARTSAQQVALQGGSSRRTATLAAAQDTLELLDLSRSISPIDTNTARALAHNSPAETADDAPARATSAYVRITRGCNKFCTYCVVPFTRGAEVHRPPQHIIDECKRLADAGVIEITLLGQTVNHYRFEHDAAITLDGLVQPQKGRVYAPPRAGDAARTDPYAGDRVTTFANLLYEVHEAVPSIQRLRFVTSYPRDFGDDVLDAIRACPRICRYIHAPAQSGSDAQLRAMNRGYSVSEYLEFISRVRSRLHQPEIARPVTISSDFIVGFPGETDADFEASASLIERCDFKNSFIFKYSPRPGTPAFDKLKDDVPEHVKRSRNNALLAVQTRVSERVSRSFVGQPTRVLIEGYSQRTLRAEGLTQGDIHKAQRLSPSRDAKTVSLTISGKDATRAQDASTDSCADGACNGSHVHAATLLAANPSPTAPTVQLVGRTDTDMIVFLDAPREAAASLLHTIVPVRIDRAEALSLYATLLESV